MLYSQQSAELLHCTVFCHVYLSTHFRELSVSPESAPTIAALHTTPRSSIAFHAVPP